MNKSQKILTLVFLALFVATLIWFPHIHIVGYGNSYGEYHEDITDLYYFVLFNYGLPPDWFKVGIEWTCLAVFYVALFFMLKNPKR